MRLVLLDLSPGYTSQETDDLAGNKKGHPLHILCFSWSEKSLDRRLCVADTVLR